jgi:hypothetical protein
LEHEEKRELGRTVEEQKQREKLGRRSEGHLYFPGVEEEHYFARRFPGFARSSF